MSFLEETLRYMGIRSHTADENLVRDIERMEHEARALSSFRSVSRACTLSCAEDHVTIDSMQIQSRDLAQYLSGCESALLIAGTMGAAADTFIRTATYQGMLKANIAQAVMTALIEEHLDEMTASLQCEYVGQSFTMRISPGYGDFPLAHQTWLIQTLDATRRIGISLNESLMMIPQKSVTAIIGVEPHINENRHTHKCEHCSKTDCAFREEI